MEPLGRGQSKVLRALALAAGLPPLLLVAFSLGHGAVPVLFMVLVVWVPIALAALAAAIWLIYRAVVLPKAVAALERTVHGWLLMASVCAVAALWLKW